jgi:hypothetical protein
VFDGTLGANAIPTMNPIVMPTWKDVRAAAVDNDYGPLGEFLRIHGVNWPADAGLVEADRGSIGAQSAGGTDESDAGADAGPDRQVRRTMSNYRLALMRKPRMVFGLLTELAHAAEFNRTACEVDEHGQPIEGSAATRHWLNTTFPKNTGRNSRTSGPGTPDPIPPRHRRSRSTWRPGDLATWRPGDLATWRPGTQAQARFVAAVTDDLVDVMIEIFRFGEQLMRAGDKAGVAPLADSADSTNRALNKALLAAHADIMSMLALLPAMTSGDATAADFESSQSAAVRGGGCRMRPGSTLVAGPVLLGRAVAKLPIVAGPWLTRAPLTPMQFADNPLLAGEGIVCAIYLITDPQGRVRWLGQVTGPTTSSAGCASTTRTGPGGGSSRNLSRSRRSTRRRRST